MLSSHFELCNTDGKCQEAFDYYASAYLHSESPFAAISVTASVLLDGFIRQGGDRRMRKFRSGVACDKEDGICRA